MICILTTLDGCTQQIEIFEPRDTIRVPFINRRINYIRSTSNIKINNYREYIFDRRIDKNICIYLEKEE